MIRPRSSSVRCAVVSTGGTIATRGADVMDRNEYMYGGSFLDSTAFLETLPQFVGRPLIEPVAFTDKPSHDIDPSDQIALARLVMTLRERGDIDAVVIQHGTNALEETAFILQLLLPPGEPVVLVGSMRPKDVIGTDADANFIDALRVAADPYAAGRGVLVSFGGQIFAASDVTKTDTRSVTGFDSSVLGPMGLVEPDGRVYFSDRSQPGPGLLERLNGACELPRVDIVVSYCGADGRLIEAAGAAGAAGIVSAGAGAGFPAALELEALRKAEANGALICRSSRVPGSYVRPPVRTSIAPDPGFLWSGHLNPHQARAVLGIALATGNVAEAQILARELFEQF